ncbi:MAG: hypothetical protein GY870_04845 [archaeon]|nr:hypothetical protein [archaeon]
MPAITFDDKQLNLFDISEGELPLQMNLMKKLKFRVINVNSPEGSLFLRIFPVYAHKVVHI